MLGVQDERCLLILINNKDVIVMCSYFDRYKSSIVLEDIENSGLYVKTEKGIRKAYNDIDIKENRLVYVDNVIAAGQDKHFVIPKGHQARYINIENNAESLDKRIKTLEKRISDLEYEFKDMFNIAYRRFPYE